MGYSRIFLEAVIEYRTSNDCSFSSDIFVKLCAEKRSKDSNFKDTLKLTGNSRYNFVKFAKSVTFSSGKLFLNDKEIVAEEDAEAEARRLHVKEKHPGGNTLFLMVNVTWVAY